MVIGQVESIWILYFYSSPRVTNCALYSQETTQLEMLINPKFHYIFSGWVSGPESADAKTLRDPSAGPGTAQEGQSQTGEYITEKLCFLL